MIRYLLQLSSARVIGAIPLPVSTLGSAKALGAAWKHAMRGTQETFTFTITNENGETLWTL